MFQGADNIILSPNPSIWELNKAIYKSFKDHHFVGYDYRKHKPKEFKGGELDKDIKGSNEFMSAIYYVGMIYDSIRNNNFEILLHFMDEVPELKEYNSFLGGEAARAEQSGEICIYCSIVLYSLIKKGCPQARHKLKYCQGLFRHQLREDFPSFIPFNKCQLGLHSWITVGDAVVDLTIGQNDYFFDFGETMPYVVGKCHEGMELIGHEELDAVVEKYKKKYAKAAGKDVELWILAHQRAGAQATIKMLQEMLEEDNINKVIDEQIKKMEKQVEEELRKKDN